MAKPIEYNPSEVLVADFVTVLAPKTGTFAPPPKGAVGKFKADDSTTYPEGWAPIGLTSAETLPTFSSDGGDATVIDTAEVAAVRNIRGNITTKFEFTLHTFNKRVLQLTQGGNDPATLEETEAELIQWSGGKPRTVNTSLLFIRADSEMTVFDYMPNAQLSANGRGETSKGALVPIPVTATVLAPTAEQVTSGAKDAIATIVPKKKAAAPVAGGGQPAAGNPGGRVGG